MTPLHPELRLENLTTLRDDIAAEMVRHFKFRGTKNGVQGIDAEFMGYCDRMHLFLCRQIREAFPMGMMPVPYDALDELHTALMHAVDEPSQAVEELPQWIDRVRGWIDAGTPDC